MRAGDCEACSGDWLRGIRASKKLDASCDACPGIQIQRLGCECDSVADTALDAHLRRIAYRRFFVFFEFVREG